MKKIHSLLMLSALTGLIFTSCNKTTTPEIPTNIKVVAWAVGLQDTNSVGMILYTDDAGETWERQGDPAMFTGIDVINVWATDQQNAWIICSENKIFRTMDGGATLIPVQAPAIPGNPGLSGISLIDNTTIWISGDQGTVYYSSNAGNNWTVYDSSFFHSGEMQGILAVNDRIVYVVGHFNSNAGDYGFIARTLNGGKTWDSISLPNNFNRYLWIGVDAVDSNHVVIYGQHGHYTVTHNGGNTWSTPDSVTAGDINALVMLSKDAYWGAFDFDQIFKTFDGGKRWVSQTSAGPLNQFLVGMDTYYSQTALIVGESAGPLRAGKILKTTDGGNHWYLRHSTDSKLWKVAFARIQE